MRLPRWLQVVLAVFLLAWLGHRQLVEVLVDWWWFDALGHGVIFSASLWTKVALWTGGFLCSAAFIGINLRMSIAAGKIDVFRLRMLIPEMEMDARRLNFGIRSILAVALFAPALLFGAAAATAWLDVLSYLHRQPFGATDPVYGLDIGYYFFQLPVLGFMQAWAMGLLLVTMLVVGLHSAVRDSFVGRHPSGLRRAARAHLLLLGALLFVVVAAGWWLQRFDLLYQRHGVVWGMGYTDLTARLPGFWIMAGGACLVALVLAVASKRQSWQLPGIALAAYLLLRILIVGAWPAVVQDYVVKPNELGLESEYLQRNIAATRSAYALDRIEVEPFEAETNLTMEDIRANPLTIENVRVWDDRPLLTTFSQIQEIRLYYDFVDVDVDRYLIGGQLRQVMLSARELNYANVPSQGQSWVNEHFQYTHGYGLTMNPVNMVTKEGLPDLFIQDIPPVSKVGLEVDRPEIYYGEMTDRYVFVKTGIDEFDYATGDQNAYTTYAGQGGVGIGGLWRKLVFAVHFGSLDILLSKYLQPDSRVLFRRVVAERVRHLAPFLQFDRDPYLVLEGGRLYWMIDAYTVSGRYPYSEPMSSERTGGLNYIRNAVKVVLDAYDGSIALYVADDQDPMIKVYQGIFPGSFIPIEQMPDELRAHQRYPVDFFDIQGAMYRAYHMNDPNVFYNKEDMWAVPRELYGGREQTMESYYLVMKLPGEERAEFILLVPFVPTNRDNMISWMAARCDPEVYGRLTLFQFPKQKLIYGPLQIEARIDQDPGISELMTLWSQGGSRVVRGNLLVIPIGNSLMYVEPLYLQAESSQLPELKRVIVSYENHIAMEETLDLALRKIFAPTSSQRSPRDSSQDVPALEGEQAQAAGWSVLAGQAASQLDQARQRQREGDWAGYGQALEGLAATIEELEQLALQDPAVLAEEEELKTPQGEPELEAQPTVEE